MNINLLCLPFAGGSKYSYLPIKPYIEGNVNMITLDLPGRGSRIDENLLDNIDDMVADIFHQFSPYYQGRYAVFGHSMGALLAYLLVRRIISQGLPAPYCLIVAGREAPILNRQIDTTYLLPKEEFLTRIKALQGIPEEVYQDDVLMDFFEPILRADFCAVETYLHAQYEPLNIPIHVVKGTNENFSVEDALGWRNETCGAFTFEQIEGGHFFPLKSPKAFSDTLLKKLFGK
ncbi:Surfactin synthase thioesterase subunit [compost metagenome]